MMGELQKKIEEHWDSLIDKWLQENKNPRSKYLLNTCVDWAVEEMTKEFPYPPKEVETDPDEYQDSRYNKWKDTELWKKDVLEWFAKWFMESSDEAKTA